MKPHTSNRDQPVFGSVDLDAHCLKRIHGGEAILRLQKTGDTSRALGKRPEHDRSMRDGFIPGYAGFSAKCTAGLHAKTDRVVLHGYAIFQVDLRIVAERREHRQTKQKVGPWPPSRSGWRPRLTPRGTGGSEVGSPVGLRGKYPATFSDRSMQCG